MTSTSSRPARTDSSTTYWIAGLSTTGSISLGWALVTGRKRVPSPAAGITALVTLAFTSDHPRAAQGCSSRSDHYAAGTLIARVLTAPPRSPNAHLRVRLQGL